MKNTSYINIKKKDTKNTIQYIFPRRRGSYGKHSNRREAKGQKQSTRQFRDLYLKLDKLAPTEEQNDLQKIYTK